MRAHQTNRLDLGQSTPNRSSIFRVLHGFALLSCIALFTGCQLAGSKGITADTTCRDYLQFPGDERSDAAIRISSEVSGVSNPGNPMWALSLDAACGSNPNMTISEYFDRD